MTMFVEPALATAAEERLEAEGAACRQHRDYNSTATASREYGHAHHGYHDHINHNHQDRDRGMDRMDRYQEQDEEYLMTKTAMQLGRDGLGGRPEVKPHQCQQCLKSFSSNHQLVQHIRVHTGEKPYKCSYCDRRFKQLSHVQQHTRLHTGERPYKCHIPDCGRAFIQLSNLQQHLRNHESQIERLKNRPFHCNICGKGFATESSLRTHTGKHQALVGGPNPSCCPVCQKLCMTGEQLMDHMKYVHKDPNASGVPAKRRNANHPCPVCGKFYVNEGSLRKHLACHPEMTSQLASSLRMWPCSVCTAVFTHENGLLAHMDQMRMDPKHQFAAQYVLSRAATERREREALISAAMNMSHFAMGGMGMGGMGGMGMGGSPLHSDSSTRISTPAEMKLEHGPLRSPLGHHQGQMDYSRMAMMSGFHSMSNQNSVVNNDVGRVQQNPETGRDPLRITSPAEGDINQMHQQHNNVLSPNQEANQANQDHNMRQPAPLAPPLAPQPHHQEELRQETSNANTEAVPGVVPGGDSRAEVNNSTDHRLGSHSPNGQDDMRSMDPNNAAYIALRNHPETTIRPINSNAQGEAPEQSPRAIEENLYKQQTMPGFETKYSAQQGFQAPGGMTGGSTSPSSAYNGVDMFNRYRLEMVKQMHAMTGDPRTSFGVPPFSGHQV